VAAGEAAAPASVASAPAPTKDDPIPTEEPKPAEVTAEAAAGAATAEQSAGVPEYLEPYAGVEVFCATARACKRTNSKKKVHVFTNRLQLIHRAFLTG
jgi:hypothetical protein